MIFQLIPSLHYSKLTSLTIPITCNARLLLTHRSGTTTHSTNITYHIRLIKPFKRVNDLFMASQEQKRKKITKYKLDKHGENLQIKLSLTS